MKVSNKKNSTDKKKSKFRLSSANIISITICIITIGVLIYSCIESYNMQEYYAQQKLEIEKYLATISSDSSYLDVKDELADIYLNYYNQIDQKATDAINKIIAFVAFVFPVITITNTILANRLPKEVEDKLEQIDKRLEEIEKSNLEAKATSQFISSIHSNKTTTDKILAISEVIEEYDDTSGNLYFELGSLYDDLKNYSEAEKYFKKAQKAGLPLHWFHNAMGVVYSNRITKNATPNENETLFTKSEKHYKKAIKIAEEKTIQRSDFYCNLACLYQDYGMYLKKNGQTTKAEEYIAKAQENFDTALRLDNTNKLAYYNRGLSFEECGSEHYIDAYEDFCDCIKIDPDYKLGKIALIEIAIKLFRDSQDEKYYAEAKYHYNSLMAESNRLSGIKSEIDDIHNNLLLNHNNHLIALIDKKIAELLVEESGCKAINSKEYFANIEEAIESYQSALNLFNELYKQTQKEEYKELIEEITNKLAELKEILNNQ